MSDPQVLLEVDDGIATVTLNRPDKLNALSLAVIAALDETIAEVKGRDDVGVVILTGAGPKAFAAGADIAELAALGPTEALVYARAGQDAFARIEDLGKPVIAAVNGFALGGGCELALAATLRIAADTASFGQPEVNLGLIPGFAGTQRLARQIGKARAAELVLTGRRIEADEAVAIGLVNRVVSGERLIAECRELAGEILSKAPLAVRYGLEAINRGSEAGFTEGARIEATYFGMLFATSDMKEGTAAFLEKRRPKFEGR